MESGLLLLTTATVGFLHVVLGPDHYIPFVAMSRARQWSDRKTLFITFLCGIGHVSSSAILAMLALALGSGVIKLNSIESARGIIAGWLLFGFGLAYMVWGVRQVVRKISHTHSHGELTHTHFGGKKHTHDAAKITPWVLFTIFVFGPCEPLIPLVIYPAANADTMFVLVVTATFGLTCVSTMLALVYVSLRSLEKMRFARLERYTHSLSGAAIAACGAGVLFLHL